MTSINVNIITIIPLVLILILLIYDKDMRNCLSDYYICAALLTVLQLVLESITVVNNMPGTAAAVISRIVNAFGFTISPFITFCLLLIYLRRTSKRFKIILALPAILNSVLCFVSIGTNWIFEISSLNEYTRGKQFAIQLVVNALYICIFIIVGFFTRHKLMWEEKIAVTISAALVIVGITYQIVFPKELYIWSSVSVFFVIYFIIKQNSLLRRDTLTTLYNRYMYERIIAKLNMKTNAVIVNIDINYFKYINDTFGHSVGDRVLREVSGLLKDEFKSDSYCFRTGGDEFCIIIPNGNVELAEATVVKIEGMLSAVKKEMNIGVMLAYGCEEYTVAGSMDIYNVIRNADRIMYGNKRRRTLE